MKKEYQTQIVHLLHEKWSQNVQYPDQKQNQKSIQRWTNWWEASRIQVYWRYCPSSFTCICSSTIVSLFNESYVSVELKLVPRCGDQYDRQKEGQREFWCQYAWVLRYRQYRKDCSHWDWETPTIEVVMTWIMLMLCTGVGGSRTLLPPSCRHFLEIGLLSPPRLSTSLLVAE